MGAHDRTSKGGRLKMQISLIVKDQQVKQSFKVLGDALPGIVNQNMNAVMNTAAKKVSHYPPKRARQKYVRTDIFGRSVKVKEAKRTGRGTGTYARRATLVTDAVQKGRHYSVYVTGNAQGKRQAWMHKGRWAVAADEVTNASQKLIANIQRDLDKRLNAVK